MDTITYIHHQFDALRRQVNTTLADLSDEQLNWTPPGLANKIGVTLLHTVGGEDWMIQSWLQGKPMLWETQGWGARIGVATPAGGSESSWEEARQATLKLAPILAYQEAVCEATGAYLAALTPEELERPVQIFNRDRPAAHLLVIVESHILGHMGEIAALKGVHGGKGLPY
jgi:hypothetical protein